MLNIRNIITHNRVMIVRKHESNKEVIQSGDLIFCLANGLLAICKGFDSQDYPIVTNKSDQSLPSGFNKSWWIPVRLLFLSNDLITEDMVDFWFVDDSRDSYKFTQYFCDSGVTENFILTKEINFPNIKGCKQILQSYPALKNNPRMSKSMLRNILKMTRYHVES